MRYDFRVAYQWRLLQVQPSSPSLQKRTFGIDETRHSIDWMPFMSPNIQRKSTEEEGQKTGLCLEKRCITSTEASGKAMNRSAQCSRRLLGGRPVSAAHRGNNICYCWDIVSQLLQKCLLNFICRVVKMPRDNKHPINQ